MNDQIMKSNPWEKTGDTLERLIDKIILDFNPGATDDQSVELIEDPDQRLEAIEYLHEKLGKMIREY